VNEDKRAADADCFQELDSVVGLSNSSFSSAAEFFVAIFTSHRPLPTSHCFSGVVGCRTKISEEDFLAVRFVVMVVGSFGGHKY
jgi:hypothetical protein